MKLIFAITIAATIAGCATVNCNFQGDNNTVSIEQPKSVTATPSATVSGNTVPISPK